MKTPLASWHTAHGVPLIEDRGVALPLKYTDPEEEYRVVKEKAGLIDLAFRSQIRMMGEDRVSFLQGMISNDVKSLKPGYGCLATLLTEQGRIIADLRVYALENCFLLDVDVRIKDKVIETLSRFIIADDVEMEDLSEAQATVSLQGPKAAQVLAAAGAPFSLTKELQHCEATIHAVIVRLIRISDTGEDGCEILMPCAQAETIWQALLKSGEAMGVQPVGLAALNILRIEAGIPWYGLDMDESRIVLEVGLEQAISFKKGCYLGQEVVERATARGQMNRKLSGFIIQNGDAPAPGDKLLSDGKEVGWVTSVAHSPRLGKPIGLGYVRREHLTPGATLRIDRPGTAMIAEISTLPFPR